MSVLNVQRFYDQNQWNAREAYYLQALSNLTIPVNPSSADVKYIQGACANLMDEAIMDAHYINAQHDDYKGKLEAVEAELYLYFKEEATRLNIKRTEGEIKALTRSALEEKATALQMQEVQAMGLGSLTIYEALRACRYREGFMKQVNRILENKNKALLVDTGILKLEASVV